MKKFQIIILIFLSSFFIANSSRENVVSQLKDIRVKMNIDSHWKFSKGYKSFNGDIPWAWRYSAGDRKWQTINLPHDWSIFGPFNENNPSGRWGGYLPGGIGWYRKHFNLSEIYKGKKIFVEFDGVYMNSTVWINGVFLGNHPYGYTSFFYDIAPYVNFGDRENIIAVKVDNSKQPNSRWYSGSGIYRHVFLIITDQLHIAHWGTFVTTPKISKKVALIKMKTKVINDYPSQKNCHLVTFIVDKKGAVVAVAKSFHTIPAHHAFEFTQMMKVKNPHIWSLKNPYLYKAFSIVAYNHNKVDSYTTYFGIRNFYFSSDEGFFLNGKNIKIKGTCNHFSGGPLGAALPDRAFERNLEILKKMGCNAIRTSHNPPSPVLLDYADKMGFLVMDEAFDEWKVGKTWAIKYGYRDYFDRWATKDLVSMVRRDRNHPSIILWSIGNEIPMQDRPEGAVIAKKFVELIHKEDPTRPVTSGCNQIKADNKTGFIDALDVAGYNYFQMFYNPDHLKYPHRKIIGSEDTRGYSTRGVYSKTNKSYYSNYEISGEKTWANIKARPFVAGGFLWTGFDYLGESRGWPAVGSFFGALDMCGFPKDAYYFYQSQWTKKPMLHILPHWNWPGREGQKIPVWAYTNCDSVELFLNGKSLGTKHFSAPYQFHLSWDVPYAPGELKAIGEKAGKVVCKQVVHTSGLPARIVMTADRDTIRADGRDLSYITVKIVDKNGYFVPTASNLVTFQVKGEGRIVGVGNGDELSQESFKANYRRAFNGLCLAIVQSDKTAGEIVITAMSPGLKSGKIVINTSK